MFMRILAVGTALATSLLLIIGCGTSDNLMMAKIETPSTINNSAPMSPPLCDMDENMDEDMDEDVVCDASETEATESNTPIAIPNRITMTRFLNQIGDWISTGDNVYGQEVTLRNVEVLYVEPKLTWATKRALLIYSDNDYEVWMWINHAHWYNVGQSYNLPTNEITFFGADNTDPDRTEIQLGEYR